MTDEVFMLIWLVYKKQKIALSKQTLSGATWKRPMVAQGTTKKKIFTSNPISVFTEKNNLLQ